jgi:hypothetical protein
MTFTRVFTQLMRREKQCMGFKLHSTGKNSMKNSEEGYKIQLTRCLFFKNTDVKVERKENLTH